MKDQLKLWYCCANLALKMEGMQPNKLHPSLSIDLLETTTPWAYAKRRDMQEIVKGLFLGPYSVAVRSKVSI